MAPETLEQLIIAQPCSVLQAKSLRRPASVCLLQAACVCLLQAAPPGMAQAADTLEKGRFLELLLPVCPKSRIYFYLLNVKENEPCAPSHSTLLPHLKSLEQDELLLGGMCL